MAQELNQMAMRIRYLEEQAQQLQANVQLIQQTIDALQGTLMTIGNLKDAKHLLKKMQKEREKNDGGKAIFY